MILDDANLTAPLAALAGAQPDRPAWADAALARLPERLSVPVQGCEIEVLRWGRRGDRGLLLAHGNGAHASWWSYLAPLLADEGWNVAALSWSGMGGSGWRDSYSIETFVAELFAAAEVAGLYDHPGKPVFAGHSFGGFPVMAAGADHPDRLAGIITLDSSVEPPDQMWDGPPRRTLPNAVYPTLEAALARFRLAPPQHCPTLWALDHIARTSLKQVDGGWTWTFDPFLWNHFRMPDPLGWAPRVATPFTVIRGRDSMLATDAIWAYMRTVVPPGTRWVSVANARHHLMLDEPLATLSALSAVLSVQFS